ncbi:MAG TPA: PAS domain S-box protein [Methanotrichaceae archaeon]|nr:PAS domain S-box protein [Methanotrichaceae archaeon]
MTWEEERMAKARIMIVEDEAIVAMDLKEELLAIGYDVPIAVSSGEEAIEMAEKLRPDLILMDIVLEGDLDGVAAAEKITSRRDIPVIYLTAYADYLTLQRAKATGPFGYILKPYDKKTIQISIDMALNKHQMEVKLKESEARYRAVVEDQTELVCRFNDDLILTFVNDAYCRYFGKGCHDLLGQSFLQLIPEEDRQRVRELITSLSPEKTAASCECRAILMGGIRWHQWTNRAIFDDHGCLIEFQSVGRDITERKVMEMALQKSELRFRGIADRSIDLIFTTDSQGRITYVSPAAAMLGYDLEEVIGKPIESYILDSDLHQAKEGLDQVLLGGLLENYQINLIRKDGSTVAAEVNVSPVYNQGQIIGVQGIARDISERKRAEVQILAQRDLGIKLAAASSLEDAMRLCMDAVIQVSGLDCGGAYLADGSGDLRLAYSRGLSNDFAKKASRYEAGSDIWKNVMAGKPIYARAIDLAQYPEEPFLEEGLKAIAVIPMTHNGQVIACFNIASHNLDQIPEFACHALEAMITQAGNAIARLLAEEALRSSDELFRSLVDNMLDSAIIVDWDGEVLFANSSAVKLIELKPPLNQKINVLDLASPDQTELLIHDLDRVRKAQGGFLQEYKIRTLDGHEKWVECLGTRISFRGSSADLVTMRDATERKMAEEQLRLFQSAVANANDGVTISKPNAGDAFSSRVVYINEAFSRITGYGFEDAIGKDPKALIGGKDRTKEATILRAYMTNSPLRIEIESRRKDGQSFWSDLDIFPIKDGRGKITHWGSIQRDITEKKTAEERLQCSEALLRSMADNSPLAFYVVDSRTDSILYHNHLFCKIWGIEHLEEEISSGSLKNIDIIPHITPLLRDIQAFIEPCKPLQDEINGSVIEDEIPFRDGRIIRRFSAQVRDSSDHYFGRLYIFEDITERKRSEDALRESEERFRTLAISSPVGIFRTDEHGKYIYVNDRWCEISGLTESEVLGDGWKEGLCLDDRERVEEAWPPKDENFRREYRFKDLKGGVIWVLSQAVAERSSSGEVSGYMGTITDITYRKQLEEELYESNQELERRVEERTEKLAKASSKLVKAYQDMMVDLEERRQIEERLKKSNARYRAIVEDQSELVCRFLPDGTLTFANEAFCRYVGKSYDELIGQNFLGYLLEEDRDRVEGLIDALSLEKPIAVPGESRILMQSGEVRWVQWTTKAIFGEYGRLIELQSVGRDITSQKQWDERLRQAAQNWSSTFNSIQDSICLLDLDGTVLQCNKAMCQLLGRTSEEIIGKKCHMLVHGSDTFFQRCPHRTMLKTGMRAVSELLLGDRRIIVSSDPIFDESGKIINAVHTIRDITEQKDA